ncbi:MAG: class IV adenylate cyclase [Methanomethylovorans sp.]|uniref:class IV adenylate cyclase n=1 Tax=Methanomethylovorans sp. TaxID=2758717 RepID=UPI000A9C9862|nr:class IV adenylate cyclase [Methanomethylovorans sp.]
MIEIEVKARASHIFLRERLAAMGAKPEGIQEHLDTYYNSPVRDFSITDEALRIRSVNGRSVLTYKGKKIDPVSKTRPEFETEVDGDNARSILIALGFIESGTVYKKREVFSYQDMTIALDSVEGLGEFIEVEKQADHNIDDHCDEIFAFIEKLDIRKEDSIRTSYLEMVLENERKKG